MDEKNLAVKQMTMKEQAILQSQRSGISVLMVDDEELMRLCVLADEWDALYMQAYPEAAKSNFSLEGMLHWFLNIGAEKLQLDITNLVHILEGQS